MIGYLFNIVRSKPLSVAYPAIAPLLQRGSRGTPVLNPERCDANGACETACPVSAIRVERTPGAAATWQIDYGQCIFCGVCIIACPEGAIIASGAFELAARKRQAVVPRKTLEAADVRG
jgi:NADH-quinone oxidoreductase subunit I